MTTPRLPFALALALAVISPLSAQNASPTRPASPEAAAPASDRPEPPRRAISSNLARTLAASMPDYNPPPPPNAEAEEDEELATPDRPRNRIIRLPQVIVEGERPPVFTEREVYTRRGLAELAMNRYLSELDRGVLNRYTLPLFGSSQEARAMEEYRARERLRNMAETDERIAVLRDTDPAAAERLQNAAHDTFIRSPNYVVPASLARD